MLLSLYVAERTFVCKWFTSVPCLLCRQVRSATVTGKPIAFVDFKTKEAAQAAINNPPVIGALQVVEIKTPFFRLRP